MTIDEAREAEIRRLHFAEHWKVGTIVTQLGEHHEVVERVLGLGKGAPLRPAPRGGEGNEVPQQLRGYETVVTETLTQYPRLRATRLYECSSSAATRAVCVPCDGTSVACGQPPRARFSSASRR
jgi:hypothetical protein